MSKPFDWLREDLTPEQREAIKEITVREMERISKLIDGVEVDLDKKLPLDDEDE